MPQNKTYELERAKDLIQNPGLLNIGTPAGQRGTLRRANWIIEASEMGPGKHVLEVGCGGGRISKHLESMGLEVIGIDISPLALEAARRYGASDCRLMDARELGFPENYFDTASLLGNGLGLGGDVDDSRQLLSNLSRTVRPGGVLLASSINATNTEEPAHLAYHDMNRARGRPAGLVRIRVNFEDLKGDWFDLLFLELHAS